MSQWTIDHAILPMLTVIFSPSALVRSEEGGRVQKQVYEELSAKLEKIHPGITANI